MLFRSQFAKCSAVLGHPEWGEDAHFKLNRDRVAHRELIERMVSDELKRDTTAAWIVKLQAAGVPCGKINSVKEALDDPQTAARNMIETVEHPTVGQLKMLGIPMKFSATPAAVRRAPPLLNQHADEILRGELGFDAAKIAALKRNKII